jgi:hypothetical protein
MNTLIACIKDIPVMELFLILMLCGTVALLTYIQRKKDTLDLRWLILDDVTGKPSIHKIGQLCALLVSTWGFVKLIINGTLSETYFSIYMGVWAGSTALNKYLGRKAAQPSVDIQVEAQSSEDEEQK